METGVLKKLARSSRSGAVHADNYWYWHCSCTEQLNNNHAFIEELDYFMVFDRAMSVVDTVNLANYWVASIDAMPVLLRFCYSNCASVIKKQALHAGTFFIPPVFGVHSILQAGLWQHHDLFVKSTNGTGVVTPVVTICGALYHLLQIAGMITIKVKWSLFRDYWFIGHC